ncbi:macrophage mannose receptor 1 [Drosophila bipectinata]|uniref:macrophage mannose receptor 1 n=1 Tax=Drosophila bipectinata TaxID=42026 RepID=UPI001C8933A1|nr:macrophage mannose receptor 1 [Drosophila bipectinata]
MIRIFLVACTLPLWGSTFVDGSNLEQIFGPRCNPLVECDEYYSVAGFAKVTWLEANIICNRVGSVLATVRNYDQHQFMLNEVFLHGEALSDKNFWLGATNLVQSTYTWTWLSTGLPMTYAEWAEGEPLSDETEQYACLILKGDKFWHSVSCEEKHFFICENVCLLNDTSLDKRVFI